LTRMGSFELEICAYCGREFPKDPSSPTNLSCAGCRQSHHAAAEDRAKSLKARVDELEKIVSFGKSPDRELARFQGVVIGRASEGSTVAVEFLFDGHTETADLPIDMFNGNLALYGQPIDLVVRVRADGGFRYLHFEARPAGVNPALPELERLLSGVG
jgi:hypothetical protein